MVITYSRQSKPSAIRIADSSDTITLVRCSKADVNWGVARANARLNPDISNATNKRIMRTLFQQHNVPMPELYERGTIKLPAIGRPDRHTGGRGLWKCYTPADVQRALAGTRKKRAATHFMEFINAPHEYRVHIVNGKSIRISEKQFGSTGLTAHGSYTTIKPTGNIKHVRKAAKQAVRALGLDFGAVDVLATEDQCWVLEVNCSPGLGGTMPRVYAEAFQRWYES